MELAPPKAKKTAVNIAENRITFFLMLLSFGLSIMID